ncbi:protein SMAX1-LIKE 4 isoform X2 [Tripterygium wilfordii]|uniref:protein SMAX1-LIKE 4 isoform X2 n=1 Tax=Tripterygium wilfordii TaxID=458696 RepID=UPI0018F818ED|nr:protein SMAX1-LIKE 4 isoform X2 [Tripterygium wilfordii]
MRTGGCSVQQTLTVEAVSVLKQSLSLARRRGHAQVTPLHVAATLLSLRSSLLRRACLKSQTQLLPHHQSSSHHHHPLQCRALELCFNVALNRLPTTPAGPLLHGQPSLSNALIAALKRAQAHQRRGCIEQQQQQPLLTIKVELEQLVISILDDPSVSRVMREAGFSSPAVKTHIEDSTTTSSVFQCYTSSGGVFSSPCSPSHPETQREIITPNFWPAHLSTYSSERNPILFSPQKKVFGTNSTSLKQDIKQVLDVLLGTKKKNIVIVGDSVSITEGLVTELLGIIERGEVPNELKQTHFIKLNFEALSLRFMKREDVEIKLSELKRKVDSASSGWGAIIYVGDLKWTVVEDEISGSNPVEHLVAEIGRLVTKYNNNPTMKVWLMGTASYQTYMRCQMRQPPLETQWALQVVSVPSAGLGLTLHAAAAASSAHETKPFVGKQQDQDSLICCPECTSNYEREARIKSNDSPPWLQSHCGFVNQKDALAESRRKWSRLCHNLHQGTRNQNNLSSTFHNNQDRMSGGKTYSYVSSYPWWPSQDNMSCHSDSISFTDFDSRTNNDNCNQNMHKFRRQLSCEFNFSHKTSLGSLRNSQGKDEKITLALGNSFLWDSGKLEKQRIEMRKLLQENVPWQSETIPSIVEALIESKSVRRSALLLIQGNDTVGKRRLALAISESMFGSADFFLHINMRKTENGVTSFCEMLSRALRNKDRVVLVEDADLGDAQFMKFLADGYETGKFGEYSIFILATGGDSMIIADKKTNQDSVIQMGLRVIERKPIFWTPNSESKRKTEWDFSNKAKSPRIEEKKHDEYARSKMDLSRQSSFNSLDLNIKANEEDDEGEGKCEEVSQISSEITRETATAVHTPDGFFKSMDKCFILNRNAARDQEAKDAFLYKMRRCFEEITGGQNVMGFSVEERVLEELVHGSGSYLNSLFDNWVKDIFQTSLQTVLKNGGKGGTGEIRVCFEGIRGKILEEGYTGTCLPKKIQFSID